MIDKKLYSESKKYRDFIKFIDYLSSLEGEELGQKGCDKDSIKKKYDELRKSAKKKYDEDATALEKGRRVYG
jgi:hypothetical protein